MEAEYCITRHMHYAHMAAYVKTSPQFSSLYLFIFPKRCVYSLMRIAFASKKKNLLEYSCWSPIRHVLLMELIFSVPALGQ